MAHRGRGGADNGLTYELAAGRNARVAVHPVRRGRRMADTPEPLCWAVLALVGVADSESPGKAKR